MTVETLWENALRFFSLADANVRRHTEGKAVRKVIYVPKKLLNIVVG